MNGGIVFWFCLMVALLLFAVWFVVTSLGRRRRPVSLSAAACPVGGWPLPSSVVSGCCLCRGRSGRSLSGAALSSRVGRLRRRSVLL